MDEVGHITLKRMEKVQFYNNWLFSFIKPHINAPILEVGCGIGVFTKKLTDIGDTHAIDIHKYYISKTKKAAPKATVGKGDIEKGQLFFKQKKFNTIINLNVLEHIKDDKKALKNMNKLLKPKGKLILLTPAHKYAFSPLDKNLGHYRRYTKKELSQKFIDAGFDIETVRYLNVIGLFGWFLNGKILRRKVIPTSSLKIFRIISAPFLFIEKLLPIPFGLSIFIVGVKK